MEILSQAVYSLQAISGSIGFIASCWTIHKMLLRPIPFSKTFPGFVVLILAYLDGINGLFYVLNSFQSNSFGRLFGRNSSLIPTDEFFFVIYSNIWDWSQISSAFVSFTLVWQVYYILYGGLSGILQTRKWLIFIIVIFAPIPLFFGLYSIIQRVPIYFAGRFAYLVTEDNSELCYYILCRWLTPDRAMFWLIALTTFTNLIVSALAHLNLNGLISLKFNRGKPNATQLLIMRMIMAFSIASVSIWVPYLAMEIFLNHQKHEKLDTTNLIYWITLFIKVALSPARGLWHALALIYTLGIRKEAFNLRVAPPANTRTKTPIFASKKIELYCGSDSFESFSLEKWNFADSLVNLHADILEPPVKSFRYDPEY